MKLFVKAAVTAALLVSGFAASSAAMAEATLNVPSRATGRLPTFVATQNPTGGTITRVVIPTGTTPAQLIQLISQTGANVRVVPPSPSN
ncbi:hypothetical protein [Thiothrix nivea]|uniref:Uncharacterized protein n=1 Tax=Thiothrix nivea (strain ATCC 35100 / DSM 5205 / JP2) TaxID=870187 RepID=A0A656HGT3_THINJ|nr:hypothetical protein [Thiothrix nivea]EIJ34245.1 hypothetical protein Thini_1658 [Thiothrix nivea DSM 5205]